MATKKTTKAEAAKTAKTTAASALKELTIKPPKFQKAQFHIIGLSPYVQAKFSAKVINQMRDKMISGSRAKKGGAREGRDFDADYKNAMHVSREGWVGIPASSFRNAMISACRLVGFKMTLAKLAVFCEAEGYDETEGTPLVRIHGDPHPHLAHARNATGVVDLRMRPMWDTWEAWPVFRYDADLFSPQDVLNLLARVGLQVGLGEGRPDSKTSGGQGWGLFEVKLGKGEEYVPAVAAE